MSSSVGSMPIILLVNLGLAMACVASPTTFARNDRLNKNVANQQPEVVTSVTEEPVINQGPAIATTPFESPAALPAETPPAAASTPPSVVSTPPPVVAVAVEEPTGTVETPDTNSSVESGTGVNNGTGPTGTIFDCKGEGGTLVLTGTAIPTYINGSLVRSDKTYAIGCSTNFQDGIWNCKDHDSVLEIKISPDGPKKHQAVVTTQDANGNSVAMGSLSCPSKR